MFSKKQSKLVWIILAVLLAVIAGSAVIVTSILTGGSEEIAGIIPEPEAEPIIQDQPVGDDVNQTPRSPQEQPVNPPVDSQLPDNWLQLTNSEKTKLNPYRCRPDSNGIIRINLQNGRCLPASLNQQPSPEPETPPVNPRTEPPRQPSQQATHQLNQSFPATFAGHNLNLEVKVASFTCRRLDEAIMSSVRNKTASEIRSAFDNNRQSRASMSYEQRSKIDIDFGSAIEYLTNTRQHLNLPESTTANTLWQRAVEHQECTAVLELKNVGSDSVLSNGCPLNADAYVKASDTDQNSYQPKDLGPSLACTQAEVPYPTNAQIKTSVSFVAPIGATISTLSFNDGQTTVNVN